MDDILASAQNLEGLKVSCPKSFESIRISATLAEKHGSVRVSWAPLFGGGFGSSYTSATQTLGAASQPMLMDPSVVYMDGADPNSYWEGEAPAGGRSPYPLQGVPLEPGEWTPVVVHSIASDIVTVKQYRLNIYRGMLTDATLGQISVFYHTGTPNCPHSCSQLTSCHIQVPLFPTFNASGRTYGVTVPSNVPAIRVRTHSNAYCCTPIVVRWRVYDGNLTQYNYITTKTGAYYDGVESNGCEIPLFPDTTTNISITSTSQDGSATETYNISVYREVEVSLKYFYAQDENSTPLTDISPSTDYTDPLSRTNMDYLSLIHI